MFLQNVMATYSIVVDISLKTTDFNLMMALDEKSKDCQSHWILSVNHDFKKCCAN